MPISLGGHTTQFGPHVEAAFKGTNVPLLDDMADFKTGHGFGRTAKWIGKDGYRSTASRHYIYDKPRPNLTVLCRKTVSRVLIEDGVAVGVEICDAPTERGSTEVKGVRVVRARKQVIVCAGALGTPGILERSGLGDREVLEKAGVEVKVELPGVGKEYHDHQVSSRLSGKLMYRAWYKGSRWKIWMGWIDSLVRSRKCSRRQKRSGRNMEPVFSLRV